jgi:hypothetical protein
LPPRFSLPADSEVAESWIDCDVSSVASSWIDVGGLDELREHDGAVVVTASADEAGTPKPLLWSAIVGTKAAMCAKPLVIDQQLPRQPAVKKSQLIVAAEEDNEDMLLNELEMRRMKGTGTGKCRRLRNGRKMRR